jgi:hypothetical protein
VECEEVLGSLTPEVVPGMLEATNRSPRRVVDAIVEDVNEIPPNDGFGHSISGRSKQIPKTPPLSNPAKIKRGTGISELKVVRMNCLNLLKGYLVGLVTKRR